MWQGRTGLYRRVGKNRLSALLRQVCPVPPRTGLTPLNVSGSPSLIVRRSASAGRFLLSVNYHYSNLYLSTTRFIIENVSVEVDHDNIGYDKRVVWETEY